MSCQVFLAVNFQGFDAPLTLIDLLRYQKFIYLLACIAAVFPASATLHTVFTASVPAARCLVPDCDDAKSPNYSDAFSHLTFANFAIPYDTEGCF